MGHKENGGNGNWLFDLGSILQRVVERNFLTLQAIFARVVQKIPDNHKQGST
jgi:hypothetical protein